MENQTLPTPPKSLVVQGWVKSLGVALLAVGAFLGTLTATEGLDTANDGNAEAECRSTLANTVTRLQGDINVTGWTALLERVGGATDEELQRDVDELKGLVEKLRVAQDRRDRTEEICQEG